MRDGTPPCFKRISSRAEEALFYAFDLSFEETARRHAARAKSTEFSLDEMRSWYHGWQPLPFVQERRIGPEESAIEIAQRILERHAR